MHGPKWSCRAFPPPGGSGQAAEAELRRGTAQIPKGGAANGTKQRVSWCWAPDGTRCPGDSGVAISGVAMDELAAAPS